MYLICGNCKDKRNIDGLGHVESCPNCGEDENLDFIFDYEYQDKYAPIDFKEEPKPLTIEDLEEYFKSTSWEAVMDMFVKKIARENDRLWRKIKRK